MRTLSEVKILNLRSESAFQLSLQKDLNDNLVKSILSSFLKKAPSIYALELFFFNNKIIVSTVAETKTESVFTTDYYSIFYR